MKDIDPTTFTVELGKLYELSKVSGNVSVTMKRSNERTTIETGVQDEEDHAKGWRSCCQWKIDEYPTLIRATYKDTKISTIVSPNEFNKFQSTYATVIRAYMDTLKKKERTKKTKKQKTQQ
ncbi:unnamed protein product [Absidia cylindrospora]